MTTFNIGIIGGGIGGLSLAQNMKKNGIDTNVTVFERDPSPTFRNQGYRVTIHPSGETHLRACLPDALYEKFRANSYRWDSFRMMDKYERLLVDPPAEAILSRSVDRAMLRSILCSGLDNVQYGKEFLAYHETENEVEVRFVDGSIERFDLIVAADGSQSRIRGQKLPEYAELADTGYFDIASKLPWSERTQQLAKELGATAHVEVLTHTGEALVIIPQFYDGVDEDPADGYLYWGYIVACNKFNQMTGGAREGQALKGIAMKLSESYSPLLREMISSTPAEEMTLLHFLTSVKPNAVPTSRVVMMGDAIHSMPPMAGMGANTAIRDANELATRFKAVFDGKMGLFEAIEDYHKVMLDYGFAAVDLSNSNLKKAVVGHPILKRIELFVLRTLHQVAPSVMNNVIAGNLGKEG